MQRYMVLWRCSDYMQLWETVDYKEITVPEMKKTWQFIQEYIFWFLAKPKAKNDFSEEHFIIWEKDKNISDEKYRELFEITNWFSNSGYICRRNPLSLQSMPLLVHYHIAKFKNMDKEIKKILPYIK